MQHIFKTFLTKKLKPCLALRTSGPFQSVKLPRYRNYGLEPDGQTALVMIGSIFSDTHALQYSSATFADKEAVKALSALAGITDLDAFWNGMHKAALSYEGMTDEEVFFNDYKEYECAGTHYGIGCMNAVDPETAREMAGRMQAVMPSALAAAGMDMAFAQITVNEAGFSYTYLVPSNDAAQEVLRAAFGETAAFDGTSFVLSPSVSRKAVVVPAVTDVLNAQPRE